MSEQPYTPDTEAVREQYTREQPPHVGTVSSKSAEFDRWLDRVRAAARREGQAEAWEDAVASAHLHETEHFTSIKHDPNPYEGDRHVDQ